MKKYQLVLFIIILGLLPFYDGTCSRTYQIGWPFPLISYENTDTQSAALTDFFSEPSIISPHVLSSVLFDFFILLCIAFLLRRFYSSEFYLSRAHNLKFSDQFCFYYSLLFTLIGWYFILFNPKWSHLNDWLSTFYLIPMLYTGGLIVLGINKYTFDAKNIQLMPYAFLCSLIIFYWLSYVLCKIYLSIRAKLKIH